MEQQFSDAVKSLASRIVADRIARGMTWPQYAEFMDMSQSAIYKISRLQLKRKPHELTIAKVERKMAEPIPGR